MTTTLTRIKSLAELAKELKLDLFLVSYTDLLGETRAKLVPAAKIATAAIDGACFAPFASNLGLGSDAHDIAAIPDPSSLIVLPWQPNFGWLASDIYLDNRQLGHSCTLSLSVFSTLVPQPEHSILEPRADTSTVCLPRLTATACRICRNADQAQSSIDLANRVRATSNIEVFKCY